MPARKFGFMGFFGAVLALSMAAMIVVAFCDGGRKDRRPSVVATTSRLPERKLTLEEVQQSLRILIEAHPEPDINSDLHSRIERGEISYTFFPFADNMGEVTASFTVVKGDQTVPPGDPNAQFPVLYIRPEAVLAAGADATAKAWFNLVVYHEYQHYLQWKSSAEEERVTFTVMATGRPNTPAQCAAIFRHEHDAYLAECRLAARQGWKTQMDGLCEGHEEPKRLAVGVRSLFRRSYYDRTSPDCVLIWDALAK